MEVENYRFVYINVFELSLRKGGRQMNALKMRLEEKKIDISYEYFEFKLKCVYII